MDEDFVFYTFMVFIIVKSDTARGRFEGWGHILEITVVWDASKSTALQQLDFIF